VIELTRRSLVKGGALTLLASTPVPRFLSRAAGAEKETARRKVLIAVFQRGAVDGLAMVVPHTEPSYYAARPNIAIARPAKGQADAAIDLNGRFGLHPALAPLKPLWDGGRLAIVHACGSPESSRSHFDAQEYMESGTPGVKSTPDGWLSRGVQAMPAPGATPLRAVAIGPQLPRILRGGAGALAMTSVAGFDVKRGGGPVAGAVDTRHGFEAMYEQGVSDVLYGAGRESFEAVKILRDARPQDIKPANDAQYPRTRFGESLRQIAQLIRADVGLEVAFADITGWDTHVGQGNERGALAFRLREFGESLAALDKDLGDRMEDVVVLSMSEFGRTVRENGNRGTDHGHATAMLVAGGSVRGGRIHGRWPGLSPEQLFEGRDLAVTTDFRDLFAEVAARHLGIPRTAPLFPGFAVDPSRYPRVLA
jgi:uncharacterized protein (DUF1501 family)